MSRSLKNLTPIQELISFGGSGRECLSVECDCSSASSIKEAFKAVRRKFGADSISCLCYNAGYAQPMKEGDRNPMGGALVEDLLPESFEMSYKVHVSGLLLCAQEVLPSMRQRKTGSILVTGNTMSLRGGKQFGMNAPSKFAQRGLTQVMAQEYKDFGVHVAHVVIDGALDAPGMRQLAGGKRVQQEADEPGSRFLDNTHVANAFVYLAEQHPSVWTHEISLTPYKVQLGQRL